jgi:hypothetical protein
MMGAMVVAIALKCRASFLTEPIYTSRDDHMTDFLSYYNSIGRACRKVNRNQRKSKKES